MIILSKEQGENAVFYVGKEEFDEWSGLFEQLRLLFCKNRW